MPNRLPGASRRTLVAGSALLAAGPGVTAAGNKGKKPRGFATVQIIEAFVTNPATDPKSKIATSVKHVLPEENSFGEVGGGDFGPEVPIRANDAQTRSFIVEHVRGSTTAGRPCRRPRSKSSSCSSTPGSPSAAGFPGPRPGGRVLTPRRPRRRGRLLRQPA